MKRTRFTITGTPNLISEGVKALEAFSALGEDAEIATLTLKENGPIEALVAVPHEDVVLEFQYYEWDGERWFATGIYA